MMRSRRTEYGWPIIEIARRVSRTSSGSVTASAERKTIANSAKLALRERNDLVARIDRDELSAMRKGLAVVQQAPREDAHDVSVAHVRHAQLAGIAFLDERREAAVGD